MKGIAALALLALLAVTACAGPRDRAVAADSAARLAGMQQRSFATTDRYLLVRAVTTTLLSSGYAIAYAAPAADTIRASKDSLQVTITIAPYASSELRVRVEARTGAPPRDVDDPAYYEQDFFAPLSKTLELPARPVQ